MRAGLSSQHMERKNLTLDGRPLILNDILFSDQEHLRFHHSLA